MAEYEQTLKILPEILDLGEIVIDRLYQNINLYFTII